MSTFGAAGAHFQMEEHFESGRELRLSLLGELDLASIDALDQRLRELRKGGYTVHLDLSRLEFVDSTGLRVLLAAVMDSRRDGWELELDREVTEPVQRVIDLLGVRSFFWPNSA